ncbi:hypothetical protein HDU93_001994, partial [Gonapodya sp. JEL0774]
MIHQHHTWDEVATGRKKALVQEKRFFTWVERDQWNRWTLNGALAGCQLKEAPDFSTGPACWIVVDPVPDSQGQWTGEIGVAGGE